ncbi:MAG TPA: HAD family hydrolase [Candidatus Binataceae bacterium]|nr:HAD family hydrolase [Candidatus Binataceae bacterium]
MKIPKAVLFDLDDTLLDGSWLQIVINETCRVLAGRLALGLPQLAETNQRVWLEYWPTVEAQWELAVDGSFVMPEVWRRTLKACGCEDDSAVRLACETHAQLIPKARRLFDDVEGLLVALKRAGLLLGLVTNGASNVQRDKLQGLGLASAFDAIAISGETGARKPAVAAFAPVLEKMSVGPDCVWHVGDNLAADVAGAKAAGLVAIWINRNGRVRQETDPTPDLEIQSLSEMAAILRC